MQTYDTGVGALDSSYHSQSHRADEESELHHSLHDNSGEPLPPIEPQHYEEPKTTKLCGRLLLLLVAFLYGSLNVSLRGVYALPAPPSASALSTTRGWLAALCFLPLLKFGRHHEHYETIHQQTMTPVRPLWQMGVELSVWNFGAQGLVNLGLLVRLKCSFTCLRLNYPEERF